MEELYGTRKSGLFRKLHDDLSRRERRTTAPTEKRERETTIEDAIRAYFASPMEVTTISKCMDPIIASATIIDRPQINFRRSNAIVTASPERPCWTSYTQDLALHEPLSKPVPHQTENRSSSHTSLKRLCRPLCWPSMSLAPSVVMPTSFVCPTRTVSIQYQDYRKLPHSILSAFPLLLQAGTRFC